LRQLSLAQFIGEELKMNKENLEFIKNAYKIMDKLEQRIATLEKVIGKLQLRLGDVVLYIDKKEEHND
jgi:ubiquinone biosynthesis protein UbiJ